MQILYFTQKNVEWKFLLDEISSNTTFFFFKFLENFKNFENVQTTLIFFQHAKISMSDELFDWFARTLPFGKHLFHVTVLCWI